MYRATDFDHKQLSLHHIKYPFWRMTAQNPNAAYACVNLGEAVCPKEIMKQSICVDGDIGNVIHDLKHE